MRSRFPACIARNKWVRVRGVHKLSHFHTFVLRNAFQEPGPRDIIFINLPTMSGNKTEQYYNLLLPRIS